MSRPCLQIIPEKQPNSGFLIKLSRIFILEKLSKLFEQGIISYKDLSNEIINIIKSQRDEIVLRMKITTKEETEILKKRIEKLENDMNKIKKSKKVKRS